MISLHKPYVGSEELAEIKEVIDSGWLTQGPKTKEFESSVAKYLDVKYAISCSNCTAALHLALLAIGITSGDSVLVPDYTYPATAHAVMYCGAKPIFIDVNPKTYNVDVNLLEQNVLPSTKAIIPVHMFGQCADMDPILEIAKKHNLYVIEDAACAMGSKYKDRFAGAIGDINCLSFNVTKGIGIGEGGMVTTNNKKFADIVRKLAYFGIQSKQSSWDRAGSDSFSLPFFDMLGYNYKLSDVVSAIGVAQMRKIDIIIARKRELANYWTTKLLKINHIEEPYIDKDCFHNYQGYTTLIDPMIDRNKLIQILRNKGVEVHVGTYACHTQPVYKEVNTYPNSLDVYNRTLRLPLHYLLTEEDIDEAAKLLKESIEEIKDI